MEKVKKIIALVLAIVIVALLIVGSLMLQGYLWKNGLWFHAIVHIITMFFAASPAANLVKQLVVYAMSKTESE